MPVRTPLLLVAGLCGSLSAQAPVAPPLPQADIRVEGGCEVASDKGVSSFLLTLRNVGEGDTAVMLGVALGNGAEYHPANVSLRLENGSGADEFHYGPIRVGGRLDPWVVPLPAGAIYVVRVPPRRLISTRSHRFPDLGYLNGTHRAHLMLDARPISFVNEATDSLALMRLTTGRFESARFTVPEDCAGGRR